MAHFYQPLKHKPFHNKQWFTFYTERSVLSTDESELLHNAYLCWMFQ